MVIIASSIKPSGQYKSSRNLGDASPRRYLQKKTFQGCNAIREWPPFPPHLTPPLTPMHHLASMPNKIDFCPYPRRQVQVVVVWGGHVWGTFNFYPKNSGRGIRPKIQIVFYIHEGYHPLRTPASLLVPRQPPNPGHGVPAPSPCSLRGRVSHALGWGGRGDKQNSGDHGDLAETNCYFDFQFFVQWCLGRFGSASPQGAGPAGLEGLIGAGTHITVTC